MSESFVSFENTRKRFQDKLGFAPRMSAFEAVKRSDYESDEAYIDAVARYRLEQEEPEFAAMRKQVEREYAAMQAEENEARFKEECEKRVNDVVLSQVEMDNAERRAREAVEREFANGAISPKQYGSRASELYEEEINRAKHTAATSSAFNDFIRAGRGK